MIQSAHLTPSTSSQGKEEDWRGKECEGLGGCTRKTFLQKPLSCAQPGCLLYCHKQKKCSGFTITEVKRGSIWRCPNHSIKCLNKMSTENEIEVDNPDENNPKRNETKNVNVIKFLQWNARSINNKYVKLKKLMKIENVDIALIQETHLTMTREIPEIYGYKAVRQDRPTRGGGLLIYVNQDFNFKEKGGRIVEGVETLSISIQEKKGNWLDITNVYWPPAAQREYINFIDVSDNCVIAGDFNGHHRQWDAYQNPDGRGNNIKLFMSSKDLVCCNNEKSHTRQNPRCKYL